MSRSGDCANDGDLAVLNHLINVLDFDNMVKLSPKYIGLHLDMSPGRVRRAIAHWVERNVLVTGATDNGLRVYRLNRNFGEKPSLAARMQAARIRLVA